MTNFGYDLSCTDDLTLGMDEIDGSNDNVKIISESVYRRLITPRGQLIDDPDYGYYIAGLMHKGMSANELLTIPDNIKQEILKDERVESANVNLLSSNRNLGIVNLQIICTTQKEPFSLTISVSEAGAAIIEKTV